MVTTNQENPKSGSKRGLIVAFIIILLAINGVQLWLNLSKTEEIQKKEMTIQDQKTEIGKTKQELESVIKDLQQKKLELATLGADTARLGKQIAELIEERKKLSKESRINKQRYEELMDKIDEANRLRDQAEANVTYWKGIAARLDSANRDLKVRQEHFIDSLKKLNLSKEQLAEKVAIASVMKAENIRFQAINEKGKPKEGDEFRAKYIHKLRIIFNLGENKIATMGNKEVFMRIIQPDGSPLFDESMGGGFFQAEGKEIPYTLKTDVLFDNNKPEGNFIYLKGNEYKPGKHTIELYSEGFLIGSGDFTIK